MFSVLFMSLPFARKAAICFCQGLFLVFPAAVFAQTNYYATNGTEYAVVGSLPGDQVWPDVAVNTNGGFVVWQDNATDGSGWGVSATRMDRRLSGSVGRIPGECDGHERPGKRARGPVEKRRRGFCLAGRRGGIPAHLCALSDPDQHVADRHGRGGERAHEQFPDQPRRGRAEQQQRRGGLGQF